jgi:hypothetical protein
LPYTSRVSIGVPDFAMAITKMEIQMQINWRIALVMEVAAGIVVVSLET